MELVCRLKQTWWRIPEPEQTAIGLLLMEAGTIPLESASIFQALKDTTEASLPKEIETKITALLASTTMLTIQQHRFELLALYVRAQKTLLTPQKELLAGIVCNMASFQEVDATCCDRIIASAIANGYDVDAFQLFKYLLLETVKINGKS